MREAFVRFEWPTERQRQNLLCLLYTVLHHIAPYCSIFMMANSFVDAARGRREAGGERGVG